MCEAKVACTDYCQWCNECTEWQLANEPGWSPYPTPDARTTEENRLPNNSSTIGQQTISTTTTTGNTMWPILVEEDEEDDGAGDDDAGDDDATVSVSSCPEGWKSGFAN
jgi:hypothetical protein